ncbi:family 16 glycoside hydrolase [Gilvimarinus xylanilyticus]|uniref:DUF1080 domain-containing protein n=1 Tax=Gilvimarinus xylanilyticus TaxID=2944139 RepID=A0A9X2I8V1_9GAMM|nr:family 16 glycoside hydrolase [Gilvimarinus xylanilyticus]MCP8900887.1 DUF1080 domain-containing protein [Gilvimarinus xylanilyticus]
MKRYSILLGAALALGVSQAGMAAQGADNFFSYLQNSDSLAGVAVDYSNGKLVPNGDGSQLLLSGGESIESNVYLGDSVLTLEYLAGADTNAGIYLQGRYEVSLAGEQVVPGGIRGRGDDVSAIKPLAEAAQARGEWQTLELKFRAPRYDDASNKVDNAMLLEARLNGELVQKNTILTSFSEGPIKPWETTSGPALLRVREGQLAVRALSVHPADFARVSPPDATGSETNESELVDFVAVGKKAFQDLGCKECHAVSASDTSMKTGPNLFGLFKSTPRDREIIETAENHHFTVKADFSYLERSVRSPGAELAIRESGDKKGESFMPIMPPYMKQTLPDKQLDAIGYYLQTLNTPWEQGPVIKLVESTGPQKYDPLQDDLQFLVTDSVRIQRGPMEGLSARSIHVGQPNAVNYSFDPRILGIAKVWQGGYLDMTGELTNRGGDGIKTGFETREIDLGETGVLFAPLNASGEPIDFSFKESVFRDTETIKQALWSDKDQAELIAEQNAQFLGYERPSGNRAAAPTFRYRVGNNTLAVRTQVADSGAVTIQVSGKRESDQRFQLSTATLNEVAVTEGSVENGVWTLPQGEKTAELTATMALAANAWQPEATDFDYRKQPLKTVEAVADLPAGYSIENYLPPQDNYGRDQLFEALGLALAKDGTIVVATRTAGIWRIKDGQWQLFAEGLFDSLGVQIEDDHGLQVVVGQKAELTRITDTDGDGMGDKFDTLFDAHGYHGNYHTYMHGPARAADGAYHVSLNLAHADEAVYKADGEFMGSQGGYSGWNIRVTPDGEYSLYASGLRSPAGLSTGPEGKLWYTENQGEFVGTSKLFMLEQDKFYGHPSGLVDLPGKKPDSSDIQWENVADTRERAVLLFPHNIVANAPGHPVWDTTGGEFGPFAGQMLVGDQTQSNLLRVVTESVGGRLQGAVIPFMSGLESGVMRGLFLPDSSLLVGQTGRGWQAKGGHVAALQRIRYDGETVAPAIKSVNVTESGFRLSLTQPLKEALIDGSVLVRSWVYRDAPDYGSPEMDQRDESVKVSLSDNGQELLLTLANTEQTQVHPQQTARVYQITLAEGLFGDQSPPLSAFYSLWQFAESP